MAATRTLVSLATLLLVGALATPAFSQAAGGGGAAAGGGAGGNGGGRQRGNFDPAQFQKMMMDRLKEQLGSTDEEFTALEPKLQAVMTLQRDLRGGRGMGGRRGGGQNGGGTPAADTTTPQSAVQTAASDLRTLLQNKDASADDIKTKLTALRDAKTKAKADLAKAQEDLKQLLTQRQEAVLVENGLLD